MTIPERFVEKIAIRPGPACWDWLAGRDHKGYGQFWLDGGTRLAHRVSYEYANGPIPNGLQLDHLCRNRACVNPAHLEPVTGRDNLLRGETKAAMNAAATHCSNGHAFDEVNTYHWRGHRICRACGRDISRRKRAKARGES